ncbi:uncharacterized protein CBL_03532 [Carabus blaptoides fortunei]
MKQTKRKTSHKPNRNGVKQPKNNKGIATNFAEGFENPKKWYEELPENPTDVPKVPEEKLIALKDEAKKCNDAEVATYSIKNAKTNSDYQWMKTVMSKGTVSDKVAAYTVLIQDDPVCNLATLRNLINMVKVGKKKECLIVMDTLSELFLSDLLRPDIRLIPFHEQPLSKLDDLTSGSATARRKYLSIWFFEDQLKECYTSYIQALNTAAHDSVEANKEKAIGAMYKLLVGNPEQEKNLLSHIVNKLGDPSQKVASKSIYCLGQILYEHPNMKQVVLNEIEKLLFRANVSSKAQYYGVCFLTQFYLSHEDYEVAKNLIAVYFAFFKGCIKKGDVDSRMMSALLMGVNRAYPYAKTELTKISEHIDTMYKVVHVATFNVGIHAMNLLYQVSDHNDRINDRFYSVLYKKILDPQVGSTTHQAMFLNLVFRALKRDTNVNRIRAFIKRLLQITLYMQPAMACGILYLVHQLMHKNNHLLALTSKADEFINDDEAEHYSDIKKEDDTQAEENDANQDDADAPKVNQSVVDLSDIPDDDVKPDMEILNASMENKSSWVHSDKAIKTEILHPPVKCYNSYHRNPLYAGGEFCVYFELLNLQKHFHPTVALYASKIVKAENISYSGDPLKDFTLMRFLERFSFKNPKKIEDVQKPGINPIFGRRQLRVPSGVKSHAVTSKNYLNMKKEKIPVEELFMYTYLQRKHKEREEAKTAADDESDLESVGDDEFEEMLTKMSGGKNEDEELDFMNDVGETLKNEKEFGSESDEEDNLKEPAKGKKKLGKKKNDFNSIFASADEFASILDEEPNFMAGTSNAVSNKDNAHMKQLSWEQNRHRWMKGVDNMLGNRGKNKIKVVQCGARNTVESGGRKVGENKALTANKNRYNPYTTKFETCRICRQKVHQVGSHYCQACAYKKGICAMCGKKLLSTKNYMQSST